MSTDRDTARLLAVLAQRLRSNPSFMAYTLSVYQEIKGIDEATFSKKLGVLPEMLVRLALCKRPNSNSLDYTDNIRNLSDYTLIDEALLESIIMQVDSFLQSGQLMTVPEDETESAIPQSHVTRLLNTLRNFFGIFAQKPGRAVASMASIVILFVMATYLWLVFTKVPIPNITQNNSPPMDSSPETALEGRQGSDPEPEVPQDPNPPMARTSPSRRLQATNRRLNKLTAKDSIRIDLDNYHQLRNADVIGNGKEKLIELPSSRKRISLRLPESSVEGSYNIAILDAYGNQLISIPAYSSNGKTLKTILDTRNLAKKRYRLCVSHESDAPLCYPLIINDSNKSLREGRH